MVDIAEGPVANRFDSGYDNRAAPDSNRMIGPASHMRTDWKGTRP
jgi:hypothetical protein